MRSHLLCSSPLFLLLLLLLPSPAFPARKIPTTATVITADDPTWHNFSKFADIGKGSHVSGMAELKKYFHHFGYLPGPKTKPSKFSDFFDDSLESAVLLYQRNLGLPLTGKLDTQTLNLIMSPRCGVRDHAVVTDGSSSSSSRTTSRFAYFDGQPRWERNTPMNLTYAFSEDHMVDYLSFDEIKDVFRRAFSRWAAVIPVNFTEEEEGEYLKADVRIGFYRGDHGDGEPFDGVLGVLAHAFSPENGRLHLDAAETWAVDLKSQRSKVAVDLESVATHEIGHVLGLAHSSVKEAVMYPSLRPRARKVDLKVDDVVGVQALYGSNPNFRFSPLLAPYASTSTAVDLGPRTTGPPPSHRSNFLIKWPKGNVKKPRRADTAPEPQP